MNFCPNPHCPQPQNPDTVSTCQSCRSGLLLAGRYRLMKVLGQGKIRNTYEGIDIRDASLKVIKILRENHPQAITLLQQEGSALAHLQHQGLPQVPSEAYFAYPIPSKREPLHCLVMEKIIGLNLKQYLQRRGACISQKRAMQWLIQLLETLKVLHDYPLLHGNIKPSNILLRENGQLVFIDFRTTLDHALAYPLSDADKLEWSRRYCPLEQLNGQAVPSSDFFALARTFVLLLSGKSPHHLYNPYLSELQWRSATQDILNKEFADCLDRMMDSLPQHRPQQAEEILTVLKHLYQQFYQGDKNRSTLPSMDKATLPEMSPPPLPPPQPPTVFPLDPDFIHRCQTTLAEFVGPVAAILCQRTLNKNPNQSPKEFVQALAQKIPNPEQAKLFQAKLTEK